MFFIMSLLNFKFGKRPVKEEGLREIQQYVACDFP